MAYKPDYIFDETPEFSQTLEVAPGVFWVRMPLPFALDHINLWLLEDGDGWTIIDTGLNRENTKEAWKAIMGRQFGGRPLKRLIVTHFHPDHIGLAGWFVDNFSVPLLISPQEWLNGRMRFLEDRQTLGTSSHDFYQAAGFDEEMLKTVDERLGRYGASVYPIPTSYNRITDGDTILINGHKWRVMRGEGHAPEHSCLYCDDLKVLISGDQILPKISPNVAIWPDEPEANPLDLFMKSLETFKILPEDTLVLPSHGFPFKGLHGRLDDLIAHHDERLETTYQACADWVTGVDLLNVLFTRKLDDHQLFFAIGEALAHVNYLIYQGRIVKKTEPNSPWLYKSV